jgi:fructoselysine-6-P-deglycase FrlB-like protein
MRPTVRNEIFELPHTLSETLEKGKREYDFVIRKTPWGDLPKIFTGPEELRPEAEFMAGAFAGLLEWPCAVHPVSSAGAEVRSKSVCFMLSGAGDSAELQNLAQSMRGHGGTSLALVAERNDPLTQVADGAFAVCQGEKLGSVSLGVCRQAVAGYLALLTARTLKRSTPRFDALEKELVQLPQHLEKAYSQHGDGVRSLAARLAGAKDLRILAGGGYWCSATNSASLLSRLSGISSRPVRVSEDSVELPPAITRDTLVILLTGSRCAVKKRLLATVKGAKRAGAEIVTLTDGNDRDLMRLSSMTLMLPALDELTGSILCHAIMAWTAYEASRLNLMGRRSSK